MIIYIMKKKKKEKPPIENEDLSIIVRAKGEKNMSLTAYSRENGKKYTHEAFRMWLILPDQFKGLPERMTELLGINDEDSLELLKIKTMQAFAQEFGVIPQTLSRWRKEIESNDDFLKGVKGEMRKLTKNVMAALYRKVLEEGDGTRVMAWMKIVEDWREQLGVEMSGHVGDGLTPEERKALDDLIAKNKQ